MYEYPYYYSYIEKLHKDVQQQDERLKQLEQALEEMKREINELRQSKPVHIEKVEYRFDQLKVETLEGTLNIGFTPQEAAGKIEDIELGDQGKDADLTEYTPLQMELFHRVRGQIHQYLNEQASAEIRKLEEKYQTLLGDSYREQLIFDLRKQVDKRINYYLHQRTITSENQTEAEKEIYEQTKSDVIAALERHMSQLKGGNAT